MNVQLDLHSTTRLGNEPPVLEGPTHENAWSQAFWGVKLEDLKIGEIGRNINVQFAFRRSPAPSNRLQVLDSIDSLMIPERAFVTQGIIGNLKFPAEFDVCQRPATAPVSKTRNEGLNSYACSMKSNSEPQNPLNDLAFSHHYSP
jgi:hypothetical protein